MRVAATVPVMDDEAPWQAATAQVRCDSGHTYTRTRHKTCPSCELIAEFGSDDVDVISDVLRARFTDDQLRYLAMHLAYDPD